MKTPKKQFMNFGRFSKDEKRIRIKVDIHCSSCQKKVPGGLQTGEQYYESEEFEKELEDFKKNYLCGKCRDRQRINKKD